MNAYYVGYVYCLRESAGNFLYSRQPPHQWNNQQSAANKNDNMVSSQVLRFDRSDEQNCFVLVNLVNNESDSLDLTLTATEGEGAYTAKGKTTNNMSQRYKDRCLTMRQSNKQT